MAKQVINIGKIANDGLGDSLRQGAQKINENFTELYNSSIPSPAGNSGKLLSTDGNLLTWTSDILGNATTVTNGVYTTSSYTNPSWIASLAYSKLSGAPTINTLLPTQTNNNEKLLTTDGSNVSWTSEISVDAITTDSTNTPLVSSINSTLLLYSAYGINIQATGEEINVSAGASFAGPGADINMLAGNGGDVGALSSRGGHLNLSAGAAGFDESGTPPGGNVYLSGGYGEIGGAVYIKGGNYGEPGVVGDVYLQGLKYPKIDGTVGQVLTTNGSGTLSWSTASTSISRTTATITTSSLANLATATGNITGFKSYALLKIQTSQAAWIRLYTDVASQAADAGRLENTDPLPNAGVVAEVITTGADTILISPGAFGFNNETIPTTNIPVRITNKGSTAAITVTLTLLKLEQ